MIFHLAIPTSISRVRVVQHNVFCPWKPTGIFRIMRGAEGTNSYIIHFIDYISRNTRCESEALRSPLPDLSVCVLPSFEMRTPQRTRKVGGSAVFWFFFLFFFQFLLIKGFHNTSIQTLHDLIISSRSAHDLRSFKIRDKIIKKIYYLTSFYQQ